MAVVKEAVVQEEVVLPILLLILQLKMNLTV
jgi:hypothetical protein